MEEIRNILALEKLVATVLTVALGLLCVTSYFGLTCCSQVIDGLFTRENFSPAGFPGKFKVTIVIRRF